MNQHGVPKLTRCTQEAEALAALAAARERVLVPALRAAMELVAHYSQIGCTSWKGLDACAASCEGEGGGGQDVRADPTELERCYDAAISLWPDDERFWTLALAWTRNHTAVHAAAGVAQGESSAGLGVAGDAAALVDALQRVRRVLRVIVGAVEDSYVKILPPPQEALADEDGARFRATSVTVNLGREAQGSARVPGLAPGQTKRQVLADLLTGKVKKREAVRQWLAGVVRAMVAPGGSRAAARLAVSAPVAGSPSALAAPPPAVPALQGLQGNAGVASGGWAVPGADEVICDDLPGLVVEARQGLLREFDMCNPEEAALAEAAIAEGRAPVVLRRVGHAQGWRAMESWTLDRLVSEFAAGDTSGGDGAAESHVNVRLAGSANVLQCNRRHPLIEGGWFVAPSQTRAMAAEEFVARLRRDREQLGSAPLSYTCP